MAVITEYILIRYSDLAISIRRRPVEEMSKLGQNSFKLPFSTVFHAGFYWRTPVLGKTERSQPVTSVSGTAAGVVPKEAKLLDQVLQFGLAQE